jgi:uncharacterized protein (TIGR02246 family)
MLSGVVQYDNRTEETMTMPIDPTPTPIPIHEGASTPQELMRTFVSKVHTRDIEGLMALYEPGAVFEPEPGVVLADRGQIRGALEAMLGVQPRMVVTPGQVLVADDVALVVNDWSMTGTAPDGSGVTRGGRSADVVRRQPDGTWRVLIDRP